MCDFFNFLEPPNIDKEVKMLSGLNSLGSQVLSTVKLTNMSDIWLKTILQLQKGDLMIAGGDFVQPCFLCCADQQECDELATMRDMTCCTSPCTEDCQNCSDCLCKCDPDNFKNKFKRYIDDDMVLMNALMSALERGAHILFYDDDFFVKSLYKGNKPGRDYIYNTLSKYPTFYWYKLPYPGPVQLHSKILSVFYIGPAHDRKSVISHFGSFNPSFPISITLEIGIFVHGTIDNPLSRMIVDFMSDITQIFYDNNEFETKSDMPLKLLSIYATNTNYKGKSVQSDVAFCGKQFCNSDNENRVLFKEKNVSFHLGASPKQRYSRFDFGINLVRDIFTTAKKYCKVGIMNSFVEELPYCIGDSCPQVTQGSSWGPWLIQDQVADLVERKVPLYIFQKPFKGDIPPGPCGGLLGWLTNPNCPSSRRPTNYNTNSVAIRYSKHAIHWKFYMNENSVLFSTQHPIPLFYNEETGGTMGYDMLLSNCPSIVAYYDNLYQYFWSNYSQKPAFDLNSPEVLPCSSDKLNNGCCSINNSQCAMSCYKGGPSPSKIVTFDGERCRKITEGEKGTYYSLDECRDTVKWSCIDQSCERRENGHYSTLRECSNKCGRKPHQPLLSDTTKRILLHVSLFIGATIVLLLIAYLLLRKS